MFLASVQKIKYNLVVLGGIHSSTLGFGRIVCALCSVPFVASTACGRQTSTTFQRSEVIVVFNNEDIVSQDYMIGTLFKV